MLININTKAHPFLIVTTHISHIQTLVDLDDNVTGYKINLISGKALEATPQQYEHLMLYWDIPGHMQGI